MYGLTICGQCGRARVVDKSSKSSSCPYCGLSSRTDKISFFFECRDQETARQALGQAAGFEMPDPKEERAKKRKLEKTDPYSTMIYKYEHAADLDDKLVILSKGLTKSKGTFTLEDVAEIVGDKNAEKYVSAMMDRCYIAEVRPGQYRSS